MNKIEWAKLPFGYFKTNKNIRSYFKNGKWSDLEVSSSEYLNIHIAATCLHYGQQAFEGMKAFRGADNKIRLFRWEENAKRMQDSAKGILMAEVPKQLFFEAINKAVLLNKEYVPPYGTGSALYIRPLLIGTGPQVGVKPSDEYTFIVFVGPVGPYFKAGFKPVKIMLMRGFDRAAPQGTGHIKVGGNYASGLIAGKIASDLGYASALFLDSKENKYIDEAGPANFFGIKNNTYITPKSQSILPSITNKSLRQIARDFGMKVEERPVLIEELEEFEEVGACGTATVISAIKEIYDNEKDKTYKYCLDGKVGKVSQKLYDRLKGIQEGEFEDVHGWNYIVE